MNLFFPCLLMILFAGCGENTTVVLEPGSDTVSQQLPKADRTLVKDPEEVRMVNMVAADHPVSPDSLLAFAKTLQGIPYYYASTDPEKGFDCSGFITYVFNHFGVAVPRSSVDFTDYGQEIPASDAKPGDLILFTGTDSTVRVVGHMGIVESNKDGTIHFIHSTSGKNGLGVVITPMERYYRSRFVKVIRVLKEEYFLTNEQ